MINIITKRILVFEAIPKIIRLNKQNIGLYIVLLAYIVFRLFYIDFVPFWDGAFYTKCIFDAATNLHSGIIKGLNCYGHPTMGYVLFHLIFQIFNPRNIFLLNLANLLLGSMGIWAFYHLVCVIFSVSKKMKEF